MTCKSTAVKAYLSSLFFFSDAVMKSHKCSENEVKATIASTLRNAPARVIRKSGSLQVNKSGSGDTQDAHETTNE